MLRNIKTKYKNVLIYISILKATKNFDKKKF